MPDEIKLTGRKVVMKKPGDLKPYERNSRAHSETQIEQIMASIREFGFTVPILIDEANGIIAGHGREEAARRLGMAKVPCIVAAGLSDAQKRAYVIADNKLTENGGWDEAALAAELAALVGEGFDAALTGFDGLAVDELLATLESGSGDPEATPDEPDVPVSRAGDLWLCGSHRVLCGDSTSAEDVGRALGDARPHMMVTDPPYGVEYDANWRNEADRANGKPYGASAIGAVMNDNRADWSDAYALFPGDVAYVWHPAGATGLVFGESLQVSGFDIRMVIIWGKVRFPIGRGNYHVQHEPCYYAVRKGATAHWQGSRKEATLWTIDHRKSETGHSTQKPIECMRRPIVNNSERGDSVYDPFLGSGTTIIAAEMEGRDCVGLESHPPYVDIVVKRWQEFTGKDAILDSDGRAFDEIAKERIGE